jgi:hypothetical protein
LEAFAIAFLDLDLNDYRVPGPEIWDLAGHSFLLDLVDDIAHGLTLLITLDSYPIKPKDLLRFIGADKFIQQRVFLWTQRALLEQIGLRVGNVSRDTSSFQPENTILRQTPRPGQTVPARGSVDLVVSRFPASRPIIIDTTR